MINIREFTNAPVIKVESTDLNDRRYAHLNAVADYNELIEGSILEFGVYRGGTINLLADKFKNQTLYGFDSFEGLPEDWDMNDHPEKGYIEKERFALDSLPEVLNNVELIKGWFNESIPKFLETHDINPIKILHVDCDLYVSTKIVFDNLNDAIVPGTVIVFDEFYPWGRKRYRNWKEHEYKALDEWVDKHNRKFKVLYRNEHQQCSIKVTQ